MNFEQLINKLFKNGMLGRYGVGAEREQFFRSIGLCWFEVKAYVEHLPEAGKDLDQEKSPAKKKKGSTKKK